MQYIEKEQHVIESRLIIHICEFISYISPRLISVYIRFYFIKVLCGAYSQDQVQTAMGIKEKTRIRYIFLSMIIGHCCLICVTELSNRLLSNSAMLSGTAVVAQTVS